MVSCIFLCSFIHTLDGDEKELWGLQAPRALLGMERGSMSIFPVQVSAPGATTTSPGKEDTFIFL